MHEIEVSLHVKIGIPEGKKVTVGNIATAIKELGVEPKIAEQNQSPIWLQIPHKMSLPRKDMRNRRTKNGKDWRWTSDSLSPKLLTDEMV